MTRRRSSSANPRAIGPITPSAWPTNWSAPACPSQPANLLIRSTVPEGSGLSSSAALEVPPRWRSCTAARFARWNWRTLCQRAERKFVGMPCGIMDQYISVFGRAHSAVEIDCRSLGHRLVTLPAGIAFVAVNTMVKHALAGSAYRERVRECAAAVEGISAQFPEVAEPARRHAGAVRAAVRFLLPRSGRAARPPRGHGGRPRGPLRRGQRRGDLAVMGKLMVESHRSLQHDYEVSCAELDFLVDTALGIEGVWARA